MSKPTRLSDASVPPYSAADVHDRVADAYYGAFGALFMQDIQKRINWICERVDGRRVLDVGCSQGIVSHLLGRAGKQVVGIDVDTKAIEEARTYLAAENAKTKKNVTFVEADFLAHDFGAELFDTIVMAELLEHLVKPQDFVARALSLLRPGGRMIVTVPFGINDHIDHKRTYYLTEPYLLVADKFEIDDVAMLGRWIGLVGVARAPAAKGKTADTAAVPSVGLVRDLEKSFQSLERGLHTERSKGAAEIARLQNEILAIREKLGEANSKYRASTEQVAALKQKLALEEQSRKEREKQASFADDEREKIQSKYEEVLEQLESARADIVAAEKREIRTAAQNEMYHERIDDYIAKNRMAGEDIEKLKKALATAENEWLRREHSIVQLRAHVDELEEENAAIRTEYDAAKVEAGAVQEGLAAREAELAALRLRLLENDRLQAEAEDRIASLFAELDVERSGRGVAEARAQAAETKLDTARSAQALLEARLADGQADQAALLRRYDISERERVEAQQKAGSLMQIEAAFDVLRSEHDRQKTAYVELEKATQFRLEAESLVKAELEQQLQEGKAEYALLQERYEISESERLIAEEQVKSLSQIQVEFAELQAAHEKKKEVCEQLAKDATSGESRVEALKAVTRESQHSVEQARLREFRLRNSMQALAAQIERLRQEKLAAEHQAVKTKSTLSFMLGYQLIHGLRSFKSLSRLPKELWRLRKEAVKRRHDKDAKVSLSSGDSAIIRAMYGLNAAPAASPEAVNRFVNLPMEVPQLRMAGIMDEFTFNSFNPECNLMSLSPENWQQELEIFTPDLLFIESAWRGKNDMWTNKVGHACPQVTGIIDWCKKRKIPTVFWNKEDPVHFVTFLNTAVLFDYVFTTDIDCLHRYKRALGHDRVYYLPFAVQPRLHNPIEVYERKDAFSFAGAYYVRYPERVRDLSNFVAGLSDFKPVEIFDRNHGKNDPNYQFPAEYQPFIVGHLPHDRIDQAYKGYRYGINLNSIKQSQTMFARRVFELLASNTMTVSNFSRGLRLLFGDLVITSDDAVELTSRVRALTADDTRARKVRLAALRKVMKEHTYQDRLAYVLSKVGGREPEAVLPPIVVFSYAKNQEQFEVILANYARQAYAHKSLIVAMPETINTLPYVSDSSVQIIYASAAKEALLGQFLPNGSYAASLVPDDYYGANFLLDLALATRYSSAVVIGKAAHYVWSASTGLTLALDGEQYRVGKTLWARSSLMQRDVVASVMVGDWFANLYTRQFRDNEVLAIDEFNYCRNGAAAAFRESYVSSVDDVESLDTGVDLAAIYSRAETISTGSALGGDSVTNSVVWTGEALAARLGGVPKGIRLSASSNGFSIVSELPEGKHVYIYSVANHDLMEVGAEGKLRFFLDATPGLNIQLAVFYLDKDGQRLGHAIRPANWNQEVDLLPGTEKICFGLRIYGAGSCSIQALVWGHLPLQVAEVIANARHLLLTNFYPSYENLYRHAFVHRRVVSYRREGCDVDVYCLRPNEGLSYREFGNVDVASGGQWFLGKLLTATPYQSVMVHFLDEGMWLALQTVIDRTRVNVWVHGVEMQSWERRAFNYTTEEERMAAREKCEQRLTFWRSVLSPPHPNLKLIFVSQHLAAEAMQDLGFDLPPECYEIIHNPIDTALFAYQEKPVEQRKKVLSIRPYASRVYANDLSVSAVLALSARPCFADMEFRFIGDGPLFDETLEPLRRFSNVFIERRFLTQDEIADLHKRYGVFLCPTRMDSQGVSRDEAMSSGLVPVTNRVAAIPEFVDAECGMLVDPEDAQGLANALEKLYQEPEAFSRLSRAAAERVLGQSAASTIIGREMALFGAKELKS